MSSKISTRYFYGENLNNFSENIYYNTTKIEIVLTFLVLMPIFIKANRKIKIFLILLAILSIIIFRRTPYQPW